MAASLSNNNKICFNSRISVLKVYRVSINRTITKVPAIDLNLLKLRTLNDSRTVEGALKKSPGQVWYFNEKLVVLFSFTVIGCT